MTQATLSSIQLRGVREAGLPGIDLEIPLGRVIGIAGAGAHLLAQRVLLDESRRRYLLSLTPFERERLGGIGARAAVDGIEGLPPAQALPASASADATVASCLHISADLVTATRTQARVVCAECGGACASFSEEDVARLAGDQFAGQSLTVIAPMRLDNAAIPGVAEELERAGFRRVRVNGDMLRWQAFEATAVDGELQVVVDRLSAAGRTRARLGEAARTARAIAGGRTLLVDDSGQQVWVDSRRACTDCGQRVDEPDWEALVRDAAGSGSVRLDGRPVHEVMAALRLGGINELIGNLSGAVASRLRTVGTICDDMDLSRLPVWQPLRQLSHGERLLLDIASARTMGLAGILHVVLSPPSGLDAATCRRVYDGLRQLVRGGASVVVLDEGDTSMADDVVRTDAVGVISPGLPARAASSKAGSGHALHDVEQILVGPPEDGDSPFPAQQVAVPLGRLVAISGNRGSGKTQLLRLLEQQLPGGAGPRTRRIQAPAVRRVIRVAATAPKGIRWLSELLALQRPLARLFADSPVAREQKMGIEAFLLDKPGGRCSHCEGEGVIRHRLDVLEDVAVMCGRCEGRRYREEILSATSHGVSVADACGMTVAEAAAHFSRERAVSDILSAAVRSGLGERRLDTRVGDLSDVERLLARLVRHQAGGRRGDLVLVDRALAGCPPVSAQLVVDALRRLVLAGASVLASDASGQLGACADTTIELT